MTERTQSQIRLDELLNLYLENVKGRNSSDGSLELEVRFGTKGFRKLTYIDYTNVVKILKSLQFRDLQPEDFLRISSEYVDPKTGVTKMSNIRTEVSGLGNISKYCKTDNILDNNGGVYGSFEQKSLLRNDDDSLIYPVDFEDFNFRVSLQVEKKFNQGSGIIRGIIDKWSDNKKTFRLINRTTLKHDKFPLKVDLSIVRSSKKIDRNYVPEYRFTNSGVLESSMEYEIEIELDSEKIGYGTEYNTPEKIAYSLRKVIKYVLSGLQGTNYPVSYREQKDILNEYMNILWTEKKEHFVKPKNFIGPSSYTLQMYNIIPTEETNMPNINNNYTVTDKADGERKLLYISNKKKIYLIDTNMNVQYTGAVSDNDDLKGTIIDGEHILHNKEGKFINLYAAFDIYYLKGEDVRSKAFIPIENVDDKTLLNYRLPLMVNTIKDIRPKSIIKDSDVSIRIEKKKFYKSSNESSIFEQCGIILQYENDGLFEYNTDGLIFTPSLLAVGANNEKEKAKMPIKTTWEHSFKWKPVEYNTIDFLISIKKLPNGDDFVGNIFKGGISTNSNVQISQYKTLILRVGFDEKIHGYVNPCKNVLDDELPNVNNPDEDEGYRPMQFYPTNPSDNDAGICNIMLQESSNGEKIMLTKEGEIIEDNMIVEFSYEKENENKWKWTPLRVRYDKTADLRNGGNNFGNAYHVANSNWHSIHNPITDEIIKTGLGINENIGDDDVYYNAVSGKSRTKSMRDFHNKFVKNHLIKNVSSPGHNLIDLAVGKAGDFPKWIAAKLNFVFGIDIAKDNIENRKDGACARYLNNKKKKGRIPKALFVEGNSSVNIRNTEGIITDQGKKITNAVFGKGAKDVKDLGKGVYNVYGIGSEGFNICSIQFAVHYMFNSKVTLHNFLRNVSETTKEGGYFIGTSYDGNKIFKMLADKEKGESEILMEEDDKIWEITKQYDASKFSDDSSCLGYTIDVYQESINKKFPEFLVNYNYLTRLLENYGFTPLTNEESRELGFKSSIGNFKELYDIMMNENEKNRKNKYAQAEFMSKNERTISFLNNYFIYKKRRNVDAETITKNALTQTIDDELDEQDANIKINNIINETRIESLSESTPDETKPKTSKKINKKVTLSEKPEDKKPKKTIKRKINVSKPSKQKSTQASTTQASSPKVKRKINIKKD
tara:strand:- start:658 stop:4164 length:3507 start_codon:yes stop_codon:yes gene_type:complete